MINREHLKMLHQKEIERFISRTPKSAALFEKAKEVMPGGVPMSWMSKWPGEYPLFVQSASGAHFIDVDGNEYIDLCLGDTGSMTGHSPKPTVDAISKQLSKGMTAMLPTDDAVAVSKELARRFHLPLWQFTVSAQSIRVQQQYYKFLLLDQTCIHSSEILLLWFHERD